MLFYFSFAELEVMPSLFVSFSLLPLHWGSSSMGGRTMAMRGSVSTHAKEASLKICI